MTESSTAPTSIEAGTLFGDDHDGAFALVVSWPSGVGKTSICSRVIDGDAGVRDLVTTTTRAMRNGESDGVDYHFVSDEAYDALLAADEFLEHADVHRARYGATKAAFSEALKGADVVLLEIDVQGARSWHETLGDRCVSIFLLPPSLEELERRLTGRQSEGEESLKTRMANAHAEMALASTYDYVIVNTELDRAVRDVESVLTAERARPARQAPLLESLGI